jgi:hypothetical protein
MSFHGEQLKDEISTPTDGLTWKDELLDGGANRTTQSVLKMFIKSFGSTSQVVDI